MALKFFKIFLTFDGFNNGIVGGWVGYGFKSCMSDGLKETGGDYGDVMMDETAN